MSNREQDREREGTQKVFTRNPVRTTSERKNKIKKMFQVKKGFND